jgi:hypothetical protein
MTSFKFNVIKNFEKPVLGRFINPYIDYKDNIFQNGFITRELFEEEKTHALGAQQIFYLPPDTKKFSFQLKTLDIYRNGNKFYFNSGVAGLACFFTEALPTSAKEIIYVRELDPYIINYTQQELIFYTGFFRYKEDLPEEFEININFQVDIQVVN